MQWILLIVGIVLVAALLTAKITRKIGRIVAVAFLAFLIYAIITGRFGF